MSGLVHTDLDRWQRWQRAQAPLLRRVRRTLPRLRATEPDLALATWGEPGQGYVVVALDSASPSQLRALIDPARHVISADRAVAFLAHRGTIQALEPLMPETIVTVQVASSPPPRVTAVLSTGDHLAAGKVALDWARWSQAPYVVVQHGVLTPYAPPLPTDCHLLAWTSADAAFWTGSQNPRGAVVGSQLLWQAKLHPSSAWVTEGSVVFLGQLHGAELPRNVTRSSVAALRTDYEVIYRPHPGELDIASRLQHRAWRQQGVRVTNEGEVAEVGGPVLSHFSSGLLEAAAARLPAYAYCADPPTWLRELWERYGLARWGTSEAMQVPTTEHEPAQAIAEYLAEVSA